MQRIKCFIFCLRVGRNKDRMGEGKAVNVSLNLLSDKVNASPCKLTHGRVAHKEFKT